MQHAIRTVGIGSGLVLGFVYLCYFIGWLLIKYSEPARDLFESEYEDLGQRSGTFLVGLIAISCAAFAVSALYLLGNIFV